MGSNSMNGLRIGSTVDSKPFTLPRSAVTETFGILGTRGAGKSTAAVVLAEEMWKAKLPWVAIDPKGDWWGVRSAADGSAGLALPVFGGLHGDVPLEATAGALIADLIVERNLTAVIDVSDFSKNDRARFLVAFFDRLYKNHRTDPQPRHVFLEEAHEYIPQQVGREEGRLKDAASRILLQGRSFGLGCSLCSQRSARLHKDVLTQVSTLVAMRTLAPQDRKAIEGWVSEHDIARELLGDLPGFVAGEAWVWSPSWLQAELGVPYQRIRFRQRETFDSGATPTEWGTRKTATLADVDLGAIKDAMAETIERASADDPKVLHRRIAELEKQVKTAVPVVEVREVEKIVEVPMLPPGFDKALELLRSRLNESLRLSDTAVDEFSVLVNDLRHVAQPVAKPTVVTLMKNLEDSVTAAKAARQTAPRAVPQRDIRAAETSDMTGPQRKLLSVLATHGPRSHKQLAMQSGYTNSGGFRNIISQLRKAGWAEGTASQMQITNDGRAALGDYDRLPTGEALFEYWLDQIPAPHGNLLGELVNAWPKSMDMDVLAERTGYTNSGGFRNLISKLRTLGLVAQGQPLRLTEEFGEAIQ